MKKSLQIHAKIYAQLLAVLYAQQHVSGRLSALSRGARHLSLGVRLADPQQLDVAVKLAEPLALAAKVETVLAQRQIGLVSYQFELQNYFWESYTRADLPRLSAVGLGEQRRPIDFSFDDAPHALFTGTSGSGKTEAIKSALAGLLQLHQPDELGLIIIDQKNILREFRNVAHLVMPPAIKPDEAAGAIRYANQQLNDRIQHGRVDSVRWLVVIDEVSLLPKDSFTVEALQNLARLGREYRIHLIVGNQRATQRELPNILDNLLNRFVGQVDNAQTSAMLTGHSGLAAHKLTGKGDFLHISGGRVVRFQVAMATRADFDRLPRREIASASAVTDTRIINLPVPTDNGAGGRPHNRIEPALLAWYIHHHPATISITQARQSLGFSRRKHDFYKIFATEFITELKRLRGLA